MKKIRRITIRDVAREAGVSIATVSRVINGETSFPSETQKRVWSIAHKLGYEPSQQARKLRNGTSTERTKTNLIMRIFNLGRENPIGDRETADSVQMFDWIASQHGFFTTTYRYYQQEGFRCPLLLDRLIDGVVIGSPHREVIETIAGKVPTVALEVGSAYHYPAVPRVNSATADGLKEMLIKAYTMGHRKLAVVGGPDKKEFFSRNYLRMICNLIDEIGFELGPEHLYQPPGLSWKNHDQLMNAVADAMVPEIRKGRITLIAGEDMVYAESIWKALAERGIRAPEDVSIIGVNSSCGQSQGMEHPVTSVVHDSMQLFTSAIEILQDLIAGKGLPCTEFLVAPLMNWGTTLGKPEKRKGSS